MIVAVSVLIVGGVLIVSAAVVLLSLASEAEVLPSLRHTAGPDDEVPYSPPQPGRSPDIGPRARTRSPLTQ